MWKFIGFIISVILIVIGEYKLSNVEYKQVKIQCIEVAYSSDKYGHLTRNHYVKYPDGKIRLETGNYYQVGKSYSRKVVKDLPDRNLGVLMLGIGLVLGVVVLINGICE